MLKLFKSSKSEKEEKEKKEKKKRRFSFRRKTVTIEDLIAGIVQVEPIIILPVRENFKILESYYVYEPFAKVHIVSIPEQGGALAYYLDEFRLTDEEKEVLEKLTDLLLSEMQPTEKIEDLRMYVIREFSRLADKYRAKFKLTGERRAKITYYVERNLIGYGAIDPLMRDPNIEDISCDGVGRPVYVWHRKYESLPTNIIFNDADALNDLILKLAHMAGKHVSVAFPIVDAMLPDRHRLAATFGTEVSPRSATFTIRKFREKPFSVVELISSGVINELIAAYIWLMLEHRRTLMVAGGTGAGKTTLLNALSMFIKPGMKIVTVEEIPELNLPHENWTQLTARTSYAVGTMKTGEVSLFDLVKVSLRYRPDYIIVGEVRGEEAFVLFQAMATGHGGMSTIHAETLDYAIKRLTSPPMNIPTTYMKLMNMFLHIQRVVARRPDGRVVVTRRVTEVNEVVDYDDYRIVAKWNPKVDSHDVMLEDSYLIKDLAERMGKGEAELLEEIEKRTIVLHWMLKNGITDVWDVSRIIFRYYYDPQSVFKMAVSALGEEVEAIK